MCVYAEHDGKYMPLDPYEAYANDEARDIYFIKGCTKDDMVYFVVGFGESVDLLTLRLRSTAYG